MEAGIVLGKRFATTDRFFFKHQPVLNISQSRHATVKKIASCLWFEDQAEEAAKFYVSIFKNSKIGMTYDGK